MDTTPRERQLLRLTAEAYVTERKAGGLTCEEYTGLLVRMARHYCYMNQWTFLVYDRLGRAVEAARALDARVQQEGVDAIAPLYGLPVPMKGTAAVVDYPSGAGSGFLSQFTPTKNSALTDLIIERNGIVFGTTNVPEFAASVNTANPASGQTRNPYNHAFAPGGSSGGAASAVAMHICPLAVSEDTGGSTRVPALFCGLFGFDPARNHYPNGGNCALSITRDQIGVVGRTLEDIIFYDRALDWQGAAALHAGTAVGPPGRVGLPQAPFVVLPAGRTAGLPHENKGERKIDAAMRLKYQRAIAALRLGGIEVVEQSWPTGSAADEHGVMSLSTEPDDRCYRAARGELALWIEDYLDAAVTLKTVVSDIGAMGSHDPSGLFRMATGTETEYRYALGPYIKELVERYNSLFDAHRLDFILIPAAYVATPDLAEALSGKVEIELTNGDKEQIDIWGCVYPTNHIWKDISIPKLAVPTGLSNEGRPTGVQIWGRALDYASMFDDKLGTAHSVKFLHSVRPLVEAIHADVDLRRVAPGMVGEQLRDTPDPAEI
jgi:Asp-tRNA(Asn)/Glu-tRNA(Gln) amidotransferase A subunit family amidase